MGYMGGAGPAFARRLPLTARATLNMFLNLSLGFLVCRNEEMVIPSNQGRREASMSVFL